MHLIKLTIAGRLNRIGGMEAQIAEVGKNNTNEISFPTKQTQNGSLLMIHFDEET